MKPEPGKEIIGASGAGSTSPPDTPLKKLVLFDFDGTITTKDTLLEFARYYRGPTQYFVSMSMLSPVMALYCAKIIPNWKAKEFFLSRFFKGEKIEDFNARCCAFSTNTLPSLIRREAWKAMENYREQKATLAVVSASPENWVKPWCDQYGMICLASKLEVTNGTITGKLNGRNCYGDEKAFRIKERFNLAAFDQVIAYGDSRGDREMLALAHKAYYRPWGKN